MSLEDLREFNLRRSAPYVIPFYAINAKQNQEVVDWVNTARERLKTFYAPLFNEQKANLNIFIGSEYMPTFVSPQVADYYATQDYNNDPDININSMYRLVMSQVSLVVSNELVPNVMPNNDEYDDKISAQVTKQWLESMTYDMDFDLLRIQWEMQKKIFGEAFVVPIWNPNKGDLLQEETEEMATTDAGLPYVDEEGEEVFDDEGRPVKVSTHQRIGDIELLNPLPFDTFIDPKRKYSDAEWFFFHDYVDIHYLKKKFPKIDWQDDTQSRAPITGIKDGSPQNLKRVTYFYHKSHPLLPLGRYVVCTDEHVLVNRDLADFPSLIESQILPLVRFVDLDIGFGVRGIPILFRNGKPIANAYNALINQVYNNLEAESPRLMVHRSANFDSKRMPTGIVACEWEGQVEPVFRVPQTNTSSIFRFSDDLKKNLDEVALQTPMVRGDTPNSQLDSFIALQHFEDQRVQLATPDLKGHIKGIEHLYRNMIMLARDKYRPEDKRLIKIMGKHNTYKLRYFDPENLSRSYDVKITTTGNLANSKAAKTQMMMTLKREFPNLVQDELFIDMLGLSQSEKFTNAITAAVSSAEAENQDMLVGVAVAPPERYEDLISHWDTHRIPIQSLDFKMSPPENKDLFIRHIAATEKLMIEQAVESPTFAQRLSQLKQFPMFYTATPTNAPLEPQEPMQEMPQEPMPVDMQDPAMDMQQMQEAPLDGMNNPNPNPQFV